MRKEIEEIRQALISINALDDDARDALATLEDAIDEIDLHPESSQVREVVYTTAGTLGSNDPEANRGLAGKWRELKESLNHWEEDHPTVVLAVGRISNSLAVVGL
jgi:hypothetical protein